MVRTIYIVRGESGRFDEWVDWFVRAFADKTKARTFAAKARRRALALTKEVDSKSLTALRARNKYDPNMQPYGNEAPTYHVGEIELEE